MKNTDASNALDQITEPEPDLVASILPENWRLALEQLSNVQQDDSVEDTQSRDPILAVVQGPKGTGKSTFSKLLVNSMLGRYVHSSLVAISTRSFHFPFLQFWDFKSCLSRSGHWAD